MKLEDIEVEKNSCILNITIDRSGKKNNINKELLISINKALDMAEMDNEIKIVMIQGKDGYFCTGMDFGLFIQEEDSYLEEEANSFANLYSNTLDRLSKISKIVISYVDGEVAAGGVGLAAASDIVVASKESKFNLPEIMWGLLPAIVMPYLVRRIGYQKAYYLTLTNTKISAIEASELHLVDDITENIKLYERKITQKISRIDLESICEAKKFFKSMWIISDEMKKLTVDESIKLFTSRDTKDKIKNFILYNKFPWNK